MYYIHMLQEITEETLKYHCIHLYLKLTSDLHKTDLHKTDLCKVLSHFKKIILQKSSGLDILKFIFQNHLSEM